MGDLVPHPVRALSGVRSSLCGPFVRWQGAWRGVGEVLSRAQTGPARAVGTPPHLRASSSGFYADAKAARTRPQHGAVGALGRRRIYADLCSNAMH